MAATRAAGAFIELVPKLAPGFAAATDAEATTAGRTFASKFDRSAGATGSKLSGHIKGLVGSIGAAFGGLAIADFGKGAVERAQEEELAVTKLGVAMRNTSGASKEQVRAQAEFIDKTARATGVMKSALFPAFTNLVNVTHSSTKAQSLLKTAMDVSAGTGKPLATVVQALGRAYNGSTVGLSRLGLATKDASGHTFTFQEQMTRLNKTFGGQAAKQADTTAGRYARLKVQFQDVQEKIGSKLIPVLNTLANLWLKHAGLITGVVGALGGLFALDKAVKGLSAVRGAVTSLGTGLSTLKSVGSTAITGLSTAISFLAANPIFLVVGAVVALGAGLFLLYKHSTGFRNFVNSIGRAVVDLGRFFTRVPGYITRPFTAAFNWLRTWGVRIATLLLLGPVALVATRSGRHILSSLLDGMKSGATAVFSFASNLGGTIIGKVGDTSRWLYKHGTNLLGGFFSGITRGAVAVWGFFTGLPSNLARFMENAGQWLIDAGLRLLTGFWTGQKTGWKNISDWFGGLAGDALHALGDVGSWLLHAGEDVIGGFLRGLSGAWHKITDFISGAASHLPGVVKHVLGIGSPSRVFHEIGLNVTQGLANGLTAGNTNVQRAMGNVTAGLTSTTRPPLRAANFVPFTVPAAVQAGALAAGAGDQVVFNNYGTDARTVAFEQMRELARMRRRRS